jgi:hypothetical protein
MTGLVSVREVIVRLKDQGCTPYVAEYIDSAGCHEHIYLFMRKNIDWVRIGPWRDEYRQIINELGMDLHVIPLSDCPLVTLPSKEKPPVKELPTHPLTHPPKGQAPPPKELEKLARLKSDFMHYKANDYLFMLRKKKDTFHLTARRRDDPRSKEIDLGPYDGLIEKMCEELDIDIADIRRWKAEGRNFGSTSRGSVIARIMKGGKRDVKYVGLYEGPIVKLLEKYDIKIKSEKNGDE